jgi:4-aminobutyrate aminotransferase
VCRQRGVLLGKGGVYGNVLRIAPPLSVSAAEIEQGATAITEALVEVDTALS